MRRGGGRLGIARDLADRGAGAWLQAVAAGEAGEAGASAPGEVRVAGKRKKAAEAAFFIHIEMSG